jgi:hypothetical protein
LLTLDSLPAKLLQLVLEVLPNATRIGLLVNVANPAHAVVRNGGAEKLESPRSRRISPPADLLRLTLAYCLGAMGLRLRAAWAETVGLASLSNVALLKRLRKPCPGLRDRPSDRCRRFSPIASPTCWQL